MKAGMMGISAFFVVSREVFESYYNNAGNILQGRIFSMSRVYNFSAGPSTLPEWVLNKAASEMLDYEGSGQSVMEMSHRSITRFCSCRAVRPASLPWFR